MKKYKEYMDSVRASDTLHQRLAELEAAGKRPIPWAKYGTMAAALALVCGLGAWGMAHGGWNALADRIQPSSRPEITELDGPDIAIVEPGDVTEPGEKALGGYEVTTGSGPNAMVSYYPLPYIEYTQAGNPNRYTVSADWDIPAGAFRQEMNREHITDLLGGEDALSAHLDWDGYELTGWAVWYENGDFWGAYIDGYAGELDHFTFAVTAGQLPPTCFELPNIEEQSVCGVMVAAIGYDSTASTRQVSFMKGGYGYHFDLTGTDRELAEQRVSRLVRLVAQDGLDLASLAGVEMSQPADGGDGYSVGEPNWNDSGEGWTCPDCGMHIEAGAEHHHSADGGVDTSYYDPNGYALNAYDPSELADRGIDPGEAVPEADSPLTCRTCGGGVPDGTEHYCKLDGSGGYVCALCGQSFPAGKVHSHEICGYPLAPETYTCETCGESVPYGTAHDCAMCDGYPLPHTCEICGEAYPEGTAHTCSQGSHHQEQHHGGHH